MRGWALILLGLLGCYSPKIANGVPCGPGGECPNGQTCGLDGICGGTGMPTDAPTDEAPTEDAPIEDASIDAPVTTGDAPPGFLVAHLTPAAQAMLQQTATVSITAPTTINTGTLVA